MHIFPLSLLSQSGELELERGAGARAGGWSQSGELKLPGGRAGRQAGRQAGRKEGRQADRQADNPKILIFVQKSVFTRHKRTRFKLDLFRRNFGAFSQNFETLLVMILPRL